MVRWRVRLLTLVMAAILAGFPVLAAVCDATCASTGQSTSTGPATPAHHHHDHAAARTLPAADAPSAAQAHHHHHETAAVVPVSVDASRVSGVPSTDCSTDARFSAWLAEPRTERDSRATLSPLPPYGFVSLAAPGPLAPAANGPAQQSPPATLSRIPLVLRI